MEERIVLKRKIFLFLLGGGVLVAADFFTVRFFGGGTWTAWWIANFFHFSGGFYAFFFCRLVFLYFKPAHGIDASETAQAVLFVGAALLMGVFWEWFELAIDRYRVLIMEKPSVMTYADNIGDLLIDFLGAAFAFWFRKTTLKRNGS